MLAAPEVKPGELELEVLETSALEDLAHVSERIIDLPRARRRVRARRFRHRLFVADLPQAPVRRKQLKIDQSFVRDMLDDPDDLAISKGVIGLATAFRRKVIAEGVETVEHGEMLLQLGCDLAQGYGIARPMPAADLPAGPPPGVRMRRGPVINIRRRQGPVLKVVH
jgi:EAL domain-containing protein (putative c-di-GMP-specific phosphodiesterase class I)